MIIDDPSLSKDIRVQKAQLASRRRQRRFEKLLILARLQDNLLDEDGYPTAQTLKLIEIWPWNQPREWFEFIKSLWTHRDWGWTEKDEPHDYKKGVTVHRYHVSTAGWSGNEAIVRSMQKNEWMWHFNWVQSRRGGHYIFELKEISD